MQIFIRIAACLTAFSLSIPAFADSYGTELANWLNERGQTYWGALPEECDDLTYLRRVYLDTVGRAPSVAELRDYEESGLDRRQHVVNQVVYGEGTRSEAYNRLRAERLARAWRKVLLPPGTSNITSASSLESWLVKQFSERTSFEEIARQLVIGNEGGSGYYQNVGGLPENYAAHISRSFLGIRIECAQCHDHPFAPWTQADFWGLAAFYNEANTANPVRSFGSIDYEGKTYPAKVLWDASTDVDTRGKFARWMVDKKNPNFAANIVNRTWQQLVGRGLYPDVENLDTASEEDRKFLDEVAAKFVESNYDLYGLTAGIMKSRWYQAETSSQEPIANQFARNLKVITPEQVFDTLEQSLLLPRTRIDTASPRWSGERTQFVSRLDETSVSNPQDYQSGVPQSLMLMNGKLTNDAIDFEDSRLLRAIVEAPFLDQSSRIQTLYLAVLTREPTQLETTSLNEYLVGKNGDELQRAYGEILWALINSPEFVLCR